jgi:hypothetical protein
MEKMLLLRAEAKRIREVYAELIGINPAEVALADVIEDMEDELESD